MGAVRSETWRVLVAQAAAFLFLDWTSESAMVFDFSSLDVSSAIACVDLLAENSQR